MKLPVDLPPEVFIEAISKNLFSGDLGDKVAKHLAEIYAEITTYNRTNAAKLLNVSRTTLYEYEKDKLLGFGSDGRISVAELVKFRRSKLVLSDAPKEVVRKSHNPKRRSRVN